VINPESGKLIAEVSKAAGGAKKAEVEAKKAAAPAGGGKYYMVQSGDSLYEIAKKHGTTVDELVKAKTQRIWQIEVEKGVGG
jgi:LysM repeat protein